MKTTHTPGPWTAVPYRDGYAVRHESGKYFHHPEQRHTLFFGLYESALATASAINRKARAALAKARGNA